LIKGLKIFGLSHKFTCGNPWSMEDIKYAAETNQMRFEKEDW